MKPLNILISACGAPGSTTLVRYLSNVKERKISLYGCDQEKYPNTPYLKKIVKLFQVPTGANPEYISEIISLIKENKIDVFFCVSSAEIEYVSLYKDYIEQETDCVVLSSSHDGIINASNKRKLYEACEYLQLPHPRFIYAKTSSEMIKAVEILNKKYDTLCFKPVKGKGSRGFRILTNKIDRWDHLINHKPESKFMTIDEFKSIITQAEKEGKLSPLLIMEHIKGNAFDCMSLCKDGHTYLTTVKTREQEKWGIITRGKLIQNKQLEFYCEELVKYFGLSYNISIQFIGNKVIEINPRTSTYIYDENLNEPYMAIKLALGEKIPDIQIPFGRKLIRYFEQFEFNHADMDQCITVCKKCHKEIHKQMDCKYKDMKCK